MTIKLKAGRQYVRGDGVVTGKLVDLKEGIYQFQDPNDQRSYTENGLFLENVPDQSTDIIAEFVEPVPLPDVTPTPGLTIWA